MSTLSQVGAGDVSALLRARNPLLWIVTREEARVEGYLIEAAGAAGYVPRLWDVAQGVTDISGRTMDLGDPDPGAMLRYIDGRGAGRERGVWIMRDLSPWLSGPIGITTCRQMRNLARKLPTLPRDGAQAIIVLSPTADVPPELSGHATVIDWPMPDLAEIASILDSTIASLPDEIRDTALPGGRDAAIDAALGLAGEEAAACYAKSLVQTRCIDARSVSQEKRRVISRERVLEWFDPLPGGLDAVGGLENLKAWLVARRSAYTPEARAFGLPSPKGAMLVGVPGCGKSLTAKAIATAWQVPLLRLDLGALKSKFVGESEGNLRKALAVVGAIGRCVVWLDEVEKALAGATQGAADGGVSSDALGTVLSWMQERAGEAFVVATANDVSSLPPELLRKGRFDEVWFVDLPTREERQGVLAAALRSHGRQASPIDLAGVADCTDGFTGAELAALVPDALYAAFADGARDIRTPDLILAASVVVPLSKTSAAKIEALRAWGAGRARLATKQETAAQRSSIRSVDL
jgi:AAA+ superfamily predicted ATPase